jgi:hypothetical protein
LQRQRVTAWHTVGGEWSLDELAHLLSGYGNTALAAAPGPVDPQANPHYAAAAAHPDVAALTALLPGRTEAHVAAVCDLLKVSSLSSVHQATPWSLSPLTPFLTHIQSTLFIHNTGRACLSAPRRDTALCGV